MPSPLDQTPILPSSLPGGIPSGLPVASVGEVPTVPAPPGAAEEPMSPQDSKSARIDIENEMAALQRAEAQFQAFKGKSAAVVQKGKTDLLFQLYAMLQAQGVDPGDQQSVADFLTKLEQENPDAAMLITMLFNQLLPNDTPNEGPQGAGAVPPGVRTGVLGAQAGGQDMQPGAPDASQQ